MQHQTQTTDVHRDDNSGTATKRRGLIFLPGDPPRVMYRGEVLGPEAKPRVALDLLTYWKQYTREEQRLLRRMFRIDVEYLRLMEDILKETWSERYGSVNKLEDPAGD